MELLQLRYFYEASVSESIAKTAKKHGVPASSVSTSIKRLEEELDRRLFDRKSNRIRLNENGKALQNHLQTVFRELDQAVENFAREPEQKVLRILTLTVRDVVNAAVIRYRRIHPEVSFVIDLRPREEDSGGYDLIVADEMDDFPDRKKIKLMEKSLYLIAAANSPLANKPLVLSQLRNEAFVSLGPGRSNWRRLVQACERAGFTPKIAVETEDLGCHRNLIYQGVGIGVSRGLLPTDRAAVLNVTDFNERQTICAYTRFHETNDAVEDFLLFLKNRDR